ncbi:MAG: elongation factor P maturation arginine rhamnosyltransferase EarP [Zoogloeaceae bacterium]|jgi:uncharacterized repeat protein (TIGR03837 family)|nr:elongation factor P maturation arginine rhamnosyltransferase EarP [Zoogloeaceae bacterium]
MNWDIFCKVIDHYGDAGVCWRLARQLAREHGQAVRLWIDTPETLAPLIANSATLGIDIRRWAEHAPLPDFAPIADVIVEAFACNLPDNLVAAMAACKNPPCWINLEYLGLEDWVETCHPLPSPHPRHPRLKKYFFFPGFTPKTGGLLREDNLFACQQAFLATRSDTEKPLDISFFCYDTAPLVPLLRAWTEDAQPLRVLVAPGKAQETLSTAWKTQPHQGKLHLVAAPFVAQDAYDERLWSCDLNFVRGEDSFVRAQWAGKPFVWQPYPQTGGAHAEKLAAFLVRFTATLPAAESALLTHFWHAWNGLEAPETLTRLWPDFRAALPVFRRHAEHWRDTLAQQEDLARKLLHFCRKQV